MNHPTLLALDTASDTASVTLLHNGAYHTASHDGQRMHSRVILNLVASLLNKTNITIGNINAIIVGNGPGSFMGARLARSVAEALAMPHDTPVSYYSTLQLMAQVVHNQAKANHILVVQDARKQECYVGAYALNDGMMQPISDNSLVAPKDIALPEGFADQSITFCGSGFAAYADHIPQTLLTAHSIIAADGKQLAEAAIQLFLAHTPNQCAEEINYVRNHVADKPKQKNKGS